MPTGLYKRRDYVANAKSLNALLRAANVRQHLMNIIQTAKEVNTGRCVKNVMRPTKRKNNSQADAGSTRQHDL